MSPAQLSLAPAPRGPRPGHARHLTESLLVEVPAAAPDDTNESVFRIFETRPALIGLPVVEDGVPIGLINRNIFMQSMARPFHRELFLKKSCIAFMDKCPLVVEGNTSIQDLSFRALENGTKTLADGFIITQGGRYAGMGIGLDLVRTIADMQAEKNRLVMESIGYASIIQKSLGRASREALRQELPDHFLLWEPRDVVSGDYFYFLPREEGFFAALFDCTGHGVPGAFMTLIMTSFLQTTLTEESCQNPGAVLAALNRRVKKALGQVDHSAEEEREETETGSDDGMDAAFCWYDRATRRITFAGAHMAMLLLAPDQAEVELVNGDRAGVGYATTPLDQRWENQSRVLEEGTAVYFFSDGYVDQLGGERRIAFGKRRLCATLAEMRELPMPEQRQALLATLLAYQGAESRRDDVSALGFRV